MNTYVLISTFDEGVDNIGVTQAKTKIKAMKLFLENKVTYATLPLSRPTPTQALDFIENSADNRVDGDSQLQFTLIEIKSDVYSWSDITERITRG